MATQTKATEPTTDLNIARPRGTRDFYPQAMAWRSYLIDAWRRVSIRHGFDQVDGPIFEHLDTYKVKSGEGIVSELFHFEDRGGRQLAIRPEFTPTLARMVAAQAASLPKPIKWFATPNFCRAERPQRGRLREFWQWNIDLMGSDAAVADAEVILVAVDLLQELGLRSDQVRVKISHRDTARHILGQLGVPEDKMLQAFDLLDRREKLTDDEYMQEAQSLGLDANVVERLEQICRMRYSAGGGISSMRKSLGGGADLSGLEQLDAQLAAFGIEDWCEYDLGIVRGLAYYTGTVFEIHEATGVERAMAGGGRYDQLIELFGGPSTPAVGFGMGDVVLSQVLADKGLIPEDVLPRPDIYILAGSDQGAERLPATVTGLRRAGWHTRFSYKSTQNVGKLLKEAGQANARFAVILDDQVAEGSCSIKNMDTGEQTDGVSLAGIADHLASDA